MRIELDIFSGRPNPSWVLSTEEAAELVARVRALPQGGSQQTRLGYRGFVVHRPDSYGRSWHWLRVGGGTVTVLAGTGEGCYRDTTGIESWLIEMAKRKGFGALVDRAGGADHRGKEK